MFQAARSTLVPRHISILFVKLERPRNIKVKLRPVRNFLVVILKEIKSQKLFLASKQKEA